MTATLTNHVYELISSQNYNSFSRTIGVCVIVFLAMMLVQKEFDRASSGAQHRKALRMYDSIAIPLFFVFCTVILVRLLDLL